MKAKFQFLLDRKILNQTIVEDSSQCLRLYNGTLSEYLFLLTAHKTRKKGANIFQRLK